MTGKTMVLYRGSLKSCNYQCTYCPFSKHRGSEREYERDRQQWERFAECVLGRAESGIGAVMIVPYGEALIHHWYWEGLGRLAASCHMDAVGAQTNLSFPIEESLKRYGEAGGQTKKLRLWATFHPEMTEAKTFAERCRQLSREGVSLCAGAVGVPKQMEEIRRLRSLLPEGIYLWVNKMDGLRRRYTEGEKAAFCQIDPFFERELAPVKADPGRCQGRIFVEADGKLRRCNISPVMEGNWYGSLGHLPEENLKCTRKLCSCYLAYGGRSDVMNRMIFGDYPLFRIPRKAKAVFLDIDGTLIPAGEHKVREDKEGTAKEGASKEGPKEEGRISHRTKLDLELLKNQGARLFFATARPYEDAARKCREVWHLFEGGVFGGGGYVLWKDEKGIKERIYPISERDCLALKCLGEELGSRIIIYKREKTAYKVTFLRPGKNMWRQEELQKAGGRIEALCEHPVRFFAEGACMEIVAADACKAEGVRVLCGWTGISFSDAAAAGDSPEDEEMIRLCQRQ